MAPHSIAHITPPRRAAQAEPGFFRLNVSLIHPYAVPYITAGTVVDASPPRGAHVRRSLSHPTDRRPWLSPALAAAGAVLARYQRRIEAVLILLIVVTACRSAVVVPGERPEELPPKTDLSEESKMLREAETPATDAVTVVRERSLDGERRAPELKESHWRPIYQAGTTLGNLVGIFMEIAGRLDDAQEQINTRDKAREADAKASAAAIVKLTDELEKQRSAAGLWERRMWSMLVVLGAAGLVGSAVLGYFFGGKLAGTVAVAGAAAIGVGRFMQFTDRQSWIIDGVLIGVVIFGAVMAGGAVYVRYQRKRKEAEAEAKFLRDAIDTQKPETIREYAAKRRADDPLLNVAMEEVKPKVDPAIVAAVVEVVKRNGNGGRAGVRTDARVPPHDDVGVIV